MLAFLTFFLEKYGLDTVTKFLLKHKDLIVKLEKAELLSDLEISPTFILECGFRDKRFVLKQF